MQPLWPKQHHHRVRCRCFWTSTQVTWAQSSAEKTVVDRHCYLEIAMKILQVGPQLLTNREAEMWGKVALDPDLTEWSLERHRQHVQSVNNTWFEQARREETAFLFFTSPSQAGWENSSEPVFKPTAGQGCQGQVCTSIVHLRRHVFPARHVIPGMHLLAERIPEWLSASSGSIKPVSAVCNIDSNIDIWFYTGADSHVQHLLVECLAISTGAITPQEHQGHRERQTPTLNIEPDL